MGRRGWGANAALRRARRPIYLAQTGTQSIVLGRPSASQKAKGRDFWVTRTRDRAAFKRASRLVYLTLLVLRLSPSARPLEADETFG